MTLSTEQVKTIYVVGRLSQCLYLMGEKGVVAAVPCSWHKGMIGAFPAFDKEADAIAYLQSVSEEDTEYPILDFEVRMPIQS